MKGMNLQEQKKCGILVTVIGLVMFAIGFLLGDAHMDDFYNGLGCGLFVCGAVRLCSAMACNILCLIHHTA